MTHFKSQRVVLMIIFTVNLLPVAAAHATSTDNPQWGTKAGVLGPNETLSTTGKAEQVKIEIGENPIICKTLNFLESKGEKAVEHNFKGSKAPNPGAGTESLNYEGCEVENFKGCEINGGVAGKGKIETEPLKDTLVFSSKEAAEREESKTLTLVEPQDKVITDVKFTGTCPQSGEIKVEGGVVLGENESGEELRETRKIDFPTKTISRYFRNVGGKTEEVKVAEKESRLSRIVGTIILVVAALFAVLVRIFN
jgi:hypothetical protein